MTKSIELQPRLISQGISEWVSQLGDMTDVLMIVDFFLTSSI